MVKGISSSFEYWEYFRDELKKIFGNYKNYLKFYMWAEFWQQRRNFIAMGIRFE